MFAASLLISGMSAVAQYGAQKAQFEADSQRYTQNVINSQAAQRDDQRALTMRQMQEQEAFAQKSHLVSVEAAEKRAEVAVSAAGGNVTGISVGNLIADVSRRAGNQQVSLQRNYEMTAAQLQQEQDATVAKTQGRINQVAAPSSPSPAGAILGFAGAGLKSYTSTIGKM